MAGSNAVVQGFKQVLIPVLKDAWIEVPNAWKTDGSELRNTLDGTDIGNGTGRPRGVRKLTRTLTCEDRVLDLTG